jgi:APA family basic amino acid/polyamine antiporter
MNLFRTKPVAAAPHVDAGEVHGGPEGEATLKRALSAHHLVLLGIGAVIGAGIFVLTGHAAANHAGPAVVLSFVIAGVACGLAGLCYAEFASMLPVSGSAYSYAYATLGEFVAWFIGWMLVLEYTFAAATVSVGWSGYFTGLLDSITSGLGIPVSLPQALTAAPFDLVNGRVVSTGAIVNLPAIAIATAIAALCYRGITQSATVNSIIVLIKLLVIFLFMGFSLQFVDTSNWTPFIPEAEGAGRFGWDGVFRAASIVFFAYIGFDAVSTAAQEAKNPQRDMPIGILGSLFICTLIYIAMSAVMTGIMPYNLLGTPKPVATALETYPSLLWLKTLVEIGAIAGLSSVILVMMVGQPRIFYSMARDGLIPPAFGRIHPKHRTPHFGTVVVGLAAVLLAALLPIGRLGEMVSMGTLLAFATVCIGIPVLRRTRPDLQRAFRVPAAPLVGILGAAACLYLFYQSFKNNWHWMLGWIVIGLVIYFGYSRTHSKLNK